MTAMSTRDWFPGAQCDEERHEVAQRLREEAYRSHNQSDQAFEGIRAAIKDEWMERNWHGASQREQQVFLRLADLIEPAGRRFGDGGPAEGRQQARPDVTAIVAGRLRDLGCDGLCSYGCGCGIEDLFPCSSESKELCEPGVKVFCLSCEDAERCGDSFAWELDSRDEYAVVPPGWCAHALLLPSGRDRCATGARRHDDGIARGRGAHGERGDGITRNYTEVEE